MHAEKCVLLDGEGSLQSEQTLTCGLITRVTCYSKRNTLCGQKKRAERTGGKKRTWTFPLFIASRGFHANYNVHENLKGRLYYLSSILSAFVLRKPNIGSETTVSWEQREGKQEQRCWLVEVSGFMQYKRQKAIDIQSCWVSTWIHELFHCMEIY